LWKNLGFHPPRGAITLKITDKSVESGKLPVFSAFLSEPLMAISGRPGHTSTGPWAEIGPK
jgi:hypothetical protein